MTEIYTPEINVKHLMNKIREEIVTNSHVSSLNNQFYYSAAIKNVKSLLDLAEKISQINTTLSERFNRFPLNFNSPFKKVFLKVVDFLFKIRSQGLINFYLIKTIRNLIMLNQQLTEEVVIVQKEIDTVNNRLDSLNIKSFDSTNISGIIKELPQNY